MTRIIAFSDTHGGSNVSVMPDEVWYDGYLEMVRRCDAVLLVPGGGAIERRSDGERRGRPPRHPRLRVRSGWHPVTRRGDPMTCPHPFDVRCTGCRHLSTVGCRLPTQDEDSVTITKRYAKTLEMLAR